MKKQNVYDPLISKRQQYLLATQLVRAVLKIGASFIQTIVCLMLPQDIAAVITDDELDE